MTSQLESSRIHTSLGIAGFLVAIILPGALYGLKTFQSARERKPNPSLTSVLTNARRIYIEDDWTGLSPVAPLTAHFTLKRDNNGFVGQAEFSAGGYRGSAINANEDVAVPMDRAEAFLKTLLQSQTELGRYQPRIEHTDDYPSIKIEIETETEKVLFFTKSQGEGNIPWGATIKGRSYVVHSDTPAKALAILEPYLKYETLKKVKDLVRSASLSSETVNAVASIDAGWQLSLASTGGLLYQEMVSNRRTDGKPLAPGAPSLLPAFVKLSNGTVEPSLTRRARNAIPIRNRIGGSGCVVTIDGFILTTRSVAAAWESPYRWDPKFYGKGAVLIRLGNQSAPPEFLSYEQLPRTWIPVHSQVLNRKRISGKEVAGSLNFLSVSLPSTTSEFPARLIRVSDQHDLAIIKIDIPEPLERVRLVDTDDQMTPGDTVVVRGYPDVAPSVMTRNIDGIGSKKPTRALSTSIAEIGAVSHRTGPTSGDEVASYQLVGPVLCSGSPILRNDGQLIALVSVEAAQSGARSFAVPIRYAKELMTAGPVK